MIRARIKEKFAFLWPGIALLTLLILNLSLFYLNHGSNLEKTIAFLMNFTPTAVRDYVLGYGMFAPAVLIMLIVLQGLIAPIPGQIMTMAAGLLYGPFWGTCLTLLGNMISAALCFKISEHFGRPLVERFVPSRDIEAVDAFVRGKKGFITLILIRLNPVIGFDAISYVVGITKMDFKKYLLATFIGMTPGTIIVSIIGYELLNGNLLVMFLLSFLLVALYIGIPIVFGRRRKYF
jgi:uncharacterized membrane protein YdjX (TVP38/TMEM64 family)